MEPNKQNGTGNKVKLPQNVGYAAIRVTKELRKRIALELARANKKPFGKRITASDYLLTAINYMVDADLKQLQERSLSNADRLARDYENWTKEFGPISRDEYLGKRLSGKISAPSAGEAAQDEEGESNGTSEH